MLVDSAFSKCPHGNEEIIQDASTLQAMFEDHARKRIWQDIKEKAMKGCKNLTVDSGWYRVPDKIVEELEAAGYQVKRAFTTDYELVSVSVSWELKE